MPVWWPNDKFEWAALKNLSHRFEGFMGDSYSNCLRLALASGYEYYNQDPMTYVEELAENLPNVSSKRITQFKVNPQVSELMQIFDGAIDNNLNSMLQAEDLMVESLETEDDDIAERPVAVVEVKRKRAPPPLIPISVVRTLKENGELDTADMMDSLVTCDTPKRQKTETAEEKDL